MSVKLIVNADDYGRSSEVSRGIREAHKNGIVSSTSCLMNFANIDEDIARTLEETPDLGLGVHLVLTSGTPLLSPEQIPTLTAEAGLFPTYVPFLESLEQIDPVQLKAEWRAQIEKFVGLTGYKPTHLDSHHHAAFWSEPLFRTMLELAAENGCAIRQMAAQDDNSLNGLPEPVFETVRDFVPRLLAEFSPQYPDLFYSSFYDDLATKENLLRIIDELPPSGIYELMCHPGYADDYLLGSTTYARPRETELAILTSREIRQAVSDHGIELATFADL